MQVDPTEEWRPVVGYEGWYSVSSLGHVRRDRTTVVTRGGAYYRASRNLKAGSNGVGYLQVLLYRGSRAGRRGHRVHVLVAAAFLGPRPPGLTINHIDGNKLNNCSANLEYVTQSANILHAFAMGLSGHHPRNAILTPAIVCEIRARYSQGDVGYTELARAYGVSHANIGLIVQRKTWRHC